MHYCAAANYSSSLGYSAHDLSTQTNVFKILLVQPESPCLSLLVTYTSLLFQSWPLLSLSDKTHIQKLALNILVCRSLSGCDSTTHFLCLSGRHERVGAGHNVRAHSA